MLHMGYSSASMIARVYEFTLLYKKIDSIQWHTGGDMTAFVSESTHLVYNGTWSIFSVGQLFLGYDCQLTVWPSKNKKKSYFLFVINLITWIVQEKEGVLWNGSLEWFFFILWYSSNNFYMAFNIEYMYWKSFVKYQFLYPRHTYNKTDILNIFCTICCTM